jgi:hypothetical protein
MFYKYTAFTFIFLSACSYSFSSEGTKIQAPHLLAPPYTYAPFSRPDQNFPLKSLEPIERVKIIEQVQGKNDHQIMTTSSGAKVITDSQGNLLFLEGMMQGSYTVVTKVEPDLWRLTSYIPSGVLIGTLSKIDGGYEIKGAVNGSSINLYLYDQGSSIRIDNPSKNSAFLIPTSGEIQGPPLDQITLIDAALAGYLS